ncbi:membrane protein insertase YidC [Secundilactobacillus paracollinoides]|uniref:membrane protein insertase YidC n=1 Tax=Secundilactobacillus paracollinoides TaxID=240427 RepID=UPI00081A3041|nr:membrane protein insertase YidC [Secundilactobacillus paracollinoides]ANZ62182.1 OxaA precursor [Secundilactobacillus paracollinoides]
MKSNKPLRLGMALAGLALVLSGCVQRTKSGKPYGVVYDYLAVPGQHVMEWMANFLGHSYGWAIIVLTVVVRLVLLPLMVRQMRSSTVQQEKMAAIKPQMTALQKRQKSASTQEEQAAAGQAMMQLYRDNGISMTGGIGCLPLLIQMPIFAALYAAIQYSPELSSSSFMGIPLGKSSIVLAILSFVAYLLQGYLSMIGMPKEQQKQMRVTMVISPVFILFFTISANAGLGLYFFIGGIFACIQTIIINLYRPRIRREIEAEMKKNPPKIVEEPMPTAATPTADSSSTDSAPLTKTQATDKKNRQRNAGKQQHHHE